MRTPAALLLVSLALAGCSGEQPAVTTTPSATPLTAAQAAENAEEKRILDEAWTRMVASDAAEAKRVEQAVAELTEAEDLLGADPIPTIRGRFESCFSGDKKAFASFYSPEMADAMSRNSQLLDFEYQHECGESASSSPRPDIDALLENLEVFAKLSKQRNRMTGEPIYELCVTVKGPESCVKSSSPWDHAVEVRDGRVVFVMN